MCTAIYAKKVMGITDKLAFISPCIAKKLEMTSERGKGMISNNVTFEHLMRYVKENHIQGPSCKDEIEYGLGSIYPTPGGLKENVYWFLGEDVTEINERTQNLAAAAEEIAASSDVIVSALNEVKKKLNLLIE